MKKIYTPLPLRLLLYIDASLLCIIRRRCLQRCAIDALCRRRLQAIELSGREDAAEVGGGLC